MEAGPSSREMVDIIEIGLEDLEVNNEVLLDEDTLIADDLPMEEKTVQLGDGNILTTEKEYVSRAVQVKVQYRSKSIQVAPEKKDISTSPIKNKGIIRLPVIHSSSESSLLSSIPTVVPPLDSSYQINTSSESSDIEDEAQSTVLQQKQVQLQIMNDNPKIYLGIDPHNIFVLDRLATRLNCKRSDIMIVLRKIRLNESMEILSHVFVVSRSTISRTIKNLVGLMAGFIKAFIEWAEPTIITSNLPLAFRANYYKVQSIIDCFEIEIQKPTKPSFQALSWSEYKKANTLKYLISCTPDGSINYISKGYGGRTSDVEIVKDCGYLEKLKPGMVIMADRGFKALESILQEKNCSLLRPPSVGTGTQMSKADVHITKVIASLRVHVERVIKRVRDYSFLSAHSSFHHDLLPIIDHVVVIACGLSNLQGPLLH
ncbi:hypothetical protein M8J76_004735 [Diaphorina citri]|nr:hypothetical protein M8J76_004735 [Diaphorina citri]